MTAGIIDFDQLRELVAGYSVSGGQRGDQGRRCLPRVGGCGSVIRDHGTAAGEGWW
ncbi:MAG: hypothetical protein U5K37_05870 [Natrialbaceae archaeon]|nr:hypothetical protein [Natrialbaceae archaeon]